MTQSFDDLAQRARRSWSDDAARVYEAAADTFRAELNARAALGAQLKAARTAHGLSQPALAELSGLQQAEISRIETGVANPTADTLVRLASALQLTLTLQPTVSGVRV
ncbi:helix-turn-helix domain-containing protein [Microcella sp.]|uniref:helix-turn-helix domain-containing protein n=1 Tax=Microcella sp. TaxID=1913979 RepID=UPI00256C17EF|nr:helix-turn-helix transcriptional regulator [Microcella sp.]MBX9470384.1 helix-turn-helix domain-containing protein [Microcella sp.]